MANEQRRGSWHEVAVRPLHSPELDELKEMNDWERGRSYWRVMWSRVCRCGSRGRLISAGIRGIETQLEVRANIAEGEARRSFLRLPAAFQEYMRTHGVERSGRFVAGDPVRLVILGDTDGMEWVDLSLFLRHEYGVDLMGAPGFTEEFTMGHLVELVGEAAGSL
jgi:hypothetical protein